MSFNIIDLIKDQLSDQIMGHLGKVIGGNQTQNETALNTAIPAILSGLTGLASNQSSAGTLFNTIKDHDDSILDNLGDLLGSNKQSSLIESGSKMLGSLFGNGIVGNLANAISDYSGVRKSGAKSLLGLIAPIIFGVIKRKLMGDGSFNLGSLVNMLTGQKKNIEAAIPRDFADQLKSVGFDKIAANVTETVSDTTQVAAREGKSLLSKLLPLALLIGAALIAYNLFFKGNTRNVETRQETTTGSTINKVDSTRLTRDLGSKLNSLTTTLGSITDEASAKAALPTLTSLTDEIGSLAGMMDKLPEAARGSVSKIVTDYMPKLQDLINKISKIPGVGAIIKPVIEKLASSLALFK